MKLMCDFCKHFDVQEVPDPYYGGSDGFDYVIEILLDACDITCLLVGSNSGAGGPIFGCT